MTRAQLLAEARLWRKAGKYIEKNGVQYGLCYTVASVTHSDACDATYASMYKRLQPYTLESTHRQPAIDFPNDDQWFAFPKGESEMARCLAAYWLALECEDEAR